MKITIEKGHLCFLYDDDARDLKICLRKMLGVLFWIVLKLVHLALDTDAVVAERRYR